MNKLLPIALVLTCASCSDYYVKDKPSYEAEENSPSFLETKMTSQSLYHEETGSILEYKEDSFRVSDNQPFTHYAIELYPNNSEDLFYLINLQDVSISYYPFNYIPVRDAQHDDLSGDLDYYPVKNPHTLNGESILEARDSSYLLRQEESCVHWVDEDNSHLPILYAVWPKEKELPQDIDYIIRYNIDLSGTKTRDGEGPLTPIENWPITLPIIVRSYDSLLDSYLPMHMIKIRLSFDTYTADFYMDTNGSFNIKPLELLLPLSLDEIEHCVVSVVFESPKWIISRDNSTTPIHRVLGTVYSIWGDLQSNTLFPTHVVNLTSITNECYIHQAACHYFYHTNDFSDFILSSEYGTIIHALTATTGGLAFTTNFSSTPTIYVYDAYNTSNECIASVIHELGHVHHFNIRGSFSAFNSVSNLLVESFASYVGWSVGTDYYTSKGFVLPYPPAFINWQNRQFWTPGSSSYSPIFVDLTDTYNQPYINDPISGVPATIINQMATLRTTALQCKNHMAAYIGTYLTGAQLESYFAYYL